jgi:CTD kinase subunit gamma
MDPFEVRVRFSQHLQHLNASVTSANKAAQYAIKYRDMDEDLHSCILEQLERVGLNLKELKFGFCVQDELCGK